MANNKVTIDLQIASQGMDPAVGKSQTIKDNLTAAAGAMNRVGGGTAGSRAVSQKAEGQEYAAQRGVAAATGASARNFAAESQGLGGLVRLYATVAANTYAAAAAFSALSKAMDTTNMVKGLDQLGAASGVALGSLSKRLAQASDGAVSLREAMEATVKASSAGLNTDQILQMGDVAKKASQALGIDMTDALSRLSRGISKIEPELLDELGIFVKIEEAVSKYALSVGKSTAAITDFERRQAFANAVLEQGNKKFGEINIDTNPYAKLAATFQNLVQSGLELVNKVLGPIAKVLADNSVLLGAAIAFLATKILKMAVPALSQWQTELTKTAEVAKEKAQAINTAFGEAWVDRWETRLKLPELRQGVKTATDELKKLGLPAGTTKNVEAGYAALIKGEDLSKTQVTATKLAITNKKNELEALGEVQDRQGKRAAAALQKEIIQLETIIALNKQRQALATAETRIETAAGATPGVFSGEASRNRISRGASTTAIAYAELAAIPGQTMEKGFMDAMKNMKANLAAQGVGFIKTWATMAVGAIASATTAITLFAASIQMWVAAFAIVGTIIYGIIKYFSATKKESDLASEALTRLEGSSKSAALTLERLSMVDPLERLSVESIQARANALKELGDSGTLAVKRAFDEINKMNVGDQFLNWVSKLWGGDVQTKLSEGLADSIKNAFKLAENTQLTDEAKKSIESILGASVEAGNLDKVIKSLAASGEDEKLKQVVKIIENMGNAAAISAAKGTELKQSFQKVTTSIQEFNKSLMPTDTLSKISQDSAVAAQKLGVALADPVQALTAMRDVSNNIDLLSIFPADVAKNLMSYNGELTNIAAKVANAKVATEGYNKQIVELQKEITKLGANGAGVNTPYLVAQYESQIAELQNKTIQLNAEIETDTSKVKGVFDQAVRSSLIQSADLMAARLASEMSKARSAVLGAMAGLLGESVGGIRLRAELEKQAIAANLEVTKQSFNLASKLEEVKIELERKRLQDEKFFLEQKKAQEIPLSIEESNKLDAIPKRLANLDKLEDINKGKSNSNARTLANQGADKDVIDAQQRLEAFRVSLAAGGASIQAIDLKAKYAQEKAIFEISQKDLQLTIDKATTEKERANILSNIYGTENLSLVNAKIAAETTEQQLIDEKARNTLVQSTDQMASLYVTALADAAKSGKDLTKEQKDQLANFKDALVTAGAEVDRFDEALRLRTQIKNVNSEMLRENARAAAATKEVEFQEQLLKNAEELTKAQLEGRQQEFNALESLGILTDTFVAEKTAEFEKEKQQVNYLSKLRELSAAKEVGFRAALNKARLAEIANEDDPEIALRVLNEEIGKINKLYEAQLITVEQINVNALRSIDVTKARSVELAKQKDSFIDSKDLTEGVTDAIVTALTKGGKEGGKKLRQTITDALKKPFSTIIQAIVQPITSALASIGSSMISSAIGGAAGGAGSSMLASGLGGAAGAAGLGSLGAAASSFGSGLSAGFAGTGAVFTSPAAAAAAAGEVYTGATLASTAGSAGATAGSMLSSAAAAGPYVLAAVAVLNALGVFRTTEVKDQGITGTLGGGGPIESYQTMRKSGTLFQGPDYWAEKQSFALSEAIQSAFKDNRTATASLAETLNLNSEAVQNFTTTLGEDTYRGVTGISFKDAKTPEQQMQKIQEALVAADEKVAKFALGTDKYNKLNETSRQALTRLSSSLTLVNDMFKDLGFDLKDVGLEGADAASKLIDALGGASGAQSKLAFVYDKFYTEEQKQANILNRTTTALTKLNLELPTSRDAYVALLDTATKLGDPATLASLVDLAPAIDALYPAIEPVVESMSLLADYMELTGDKAGALALRRSEELKNLNALDAATQRRIYALQDEKDAYDKLHTALTDTIAGLKTSVKSLQDFSTSVLTGPNSTLLSPGEKLAVLETNFNRAIQAAQGSRDTAEGRKLADEAAQDVVKYGQQLVDSATTMFASGPESQRIIKQVAADSAGVADKLALAQTDAEKTITELETSNGYLKTIDYSIGELLQQYKDAKLASDTVIAMLAPNKTIIPVDRAYAAGTGDKFAQQISNAAPTATAETLSTDAKNQNALLMENNKLLQKQIELQAEQLRSNAVVVKAQTDALNLAAEDRRQADEYATRSQPDYYSGIGGGS